MKALALLVFLGGIAAATYGVQNTISPAGSASPFAAQGLRIDAVHPQINATPGHDVTYYIVVTNHGDVARTLNASVTGDGVSGSAPASVVPVGSNAAYFVTVSLPQGLSVGTHALRASISTPDGSVTRARDDLLTLRVLPTGPGYDNNNSQAKALYTGRLAATGKAFSTNDPGLIATNFPRSDDYQPATGELPVTSSISLEGIPEGVAGMQAGESRTFTFGPEKGFGNATTIEAFARVETQPRDHNLSMVTKEVSRVAFESFINATGQGDARPFAAGGLFRSDTSTDALPYRILSINATSVSYRLGVTRGENYTIFPFWPKGTSVSSVNDTTAVLHTTPTSAPGAKFTLHAYWPSATSLVSYNDTDIVLRNDPPVGFGFQAPATSTRAAVAATVHELTDAEVLVSVPSLNPLAGQSLTFDVYFTSLTK